MKKIVLGTALILMLAVTTSGYAEVKAGAYSLTPFIGGYTFEGNQDLKTGLAYGLRGGYYFTRNWGLEAYLYHVPTSNDSLPGNPAVDLLGYGAEALYHFMPEGRLVPFLAVGIGGAHYAGSQGLGNRNKFTVDYGAGLKYFLTDNIALRADVRHVLPFNDRYNDLLYTAGLTFSWGGEKKPAVVPAKAPEPTPAVASSVEVIRDSDNDGVPDTADWCPGTPAGVMVDKYGCPLDSDGDGVPNYLDKCPDTPRGVTVDKDGCPFDSDMDGVPDYLDKCPETPTGVKVDKDGCPLDSDGDGVPDYLDKCPDTPRGMTVDKDGCPPPAVKKEAPAPPMEKAIFERGRVTLNVEFDFDKSIVKEKNHEEIGNLAAVMKKYPDLKITLEGHTDNVGGAKYNQKLSERRVMAVRQYLVEKFGIEASRLGAVGYGLKMPVASNATKEGRQKNRRVEAAAEYMK